MSCRGYESLVHSPNTIVNEPKHVQLHKEKLKVHMHIHGCMDFIRVGAPSHQVPEKPHPNISVLEWPGNSQDLNPIDTLWTIIKDKVAYAQPSSVENLSH